MNIKLQPLRREDFPIIRDWIDPNIFRIFKQPIDDFQLETLLTKYGDDGKPVDLGFAAKDIDRGCIVGFIHAVIDWKNELAHIQQIIVGNNADRKQGIGSFLMRELLKKCFQDLKLHRAQLFVDEDNTAAVNFYYKMGFKTDGLMRDATKHNGKFISWYCMSLLEKEYLQNQQVSNS